MLGAVDNPEKAYRTDSKDPVRPDGTIDPAAQEEEMRRQEEEMKAAAEAQKAEAMKAEKLKLYFANKPGKEIASALMKKVDDYYEYMKITGRLTLLRRVHEHYYSGMLRGAQLLKSGKEDEYITAGINQFRNVIQHVLNKTTESRATPEPKSSNTDHRSMAQTIVAKGILDHYTRAKRIDRNVDRGAENALTLSGGWVSVEWDAEAGEDVAPNMDNPGTFEKSGEIDVNNFNPLSVAYDFTQKDPSKREWIITVRFENKYNYVARYPELADKIAAISIEKDYMKTRFLEPMDALESDNIPVYRFYHQKTPAVPEGRFVEFLSSSLVTLDGPLHYRRIPVYRCVPDEVEGSGQGYTIAFDLSIIQEIINGLYSTVVTNQASFGVSNIAIPDGLNVGVEEVLAGLNIIKYDPKAGKPEALNLTNTPTEIFKFIDKLENVMEVLSGINSVIRGQPGPQVDSGAYAALLASMAIEFNIKLQKSYVQLQEDVYTGIIEILKENATHPRLIEMAGKANRSYMKEFTNQDLSSISRVTVDVGNPLSRTTAGKLQLADTMLERGMIKTPEEYIQVATTGILEPLYEADQAQLMLIRAENERLSDEKEKATELPPQADPMTGQVIPPKTMSSVPAILTDDHMLHIKEHMVVLASPEARINPEIVKNTLAHVREHFDLLASGDPLLVLMGQPNLAPPPAPPPGGGGEPPPATDPRGPDQKKADEIKQPNQPDMPKNPMTGKRFNNQDGGMK